MWGTREAAREAQSVPVTGTFVDPLATSGLQMSAVGGVGSSTLGSEKRKLRIQLASRIRSWPARPRELEFAPSQLERTEAIASFASFAVTFERQSFCWPEAHRDTPARARLDHPSRHGSGTPPPRP